MSIRIMSRIWDESPSKGRGLLVELALADFADDEGKCWPAIETVARKARCSVRSVQDTATSMKNAGRMEIDYGVGPHGTNVYRFLFGQGVQKFHPANSDKEGVQLSVPETAPDPSVTFNSDPSQKNKEATRDEIVAGYIAKVTPHMDDLIAKHPAIDVPAQLAKWQLWLGASRKRVYSNPVQAFRYWLTNEQERIDARAKTAVLNARSRPRAANAPVSDASAWERYAAGEG